VDVLFLAVAFVFGLLAQQCRLPPLVGFLIAGFALNALGQEGGELEFLIKVMGRGTRALARSRPGDRAPWPGPGRSALGGSGALPSTAASTLMAVAPVNGARPGFSLRPGECVRQ